MCIRYTHAIFGASRSGADRRRSDVAATTERRRSGVKSLCADRRRACNFARFGKGRNNPPVLFLETRAKLVVQFCAVVHRKLVRYKYSARSTGVNWSYTLFLLRVQSCALDTACGTTATRSSAIPSCARIVIIKSTQTPDASRALYSTCGAVRGG